MYHKVNWEQQMQVLYLSSPTVCEYYYLLSDLDLVLSTDLVQACLKAFVYVCL